MDNSPAPPTTYDLPLAFFPHLSAGQGCYLRGEDAIRISSSGINTSEITVNVRLLTPDGRIQTQSERHVPNASRVVTSNTYHVGEGWLLDVEVHVSNGSPKLNMVYVWLDLVRGQTNASSVVAALAAGPVTANCKLSYPSTGIVLPSQIKGSLRQVTGTDPAANTEISESIANAVRAELLAIQFDLVTDANVANREVSVVFDTGSIVLARVPNGTAQAASLTRTYSIWPGAVRNTLLTDNTFNLPMPGIEMLAAYRFRTVTANLQATDNYGAPQYLIRETPEA